MTFRSEKLRRAVAEQPCMNCGREGQTQAAHANLSEYGESVTTCAKCGAPIHGRRADAMYCGASCRKAVWREANREQIRERGRVAGQKERLLRPEAVRARSEKWAQSNPASVLRRNQKIREGLTDAYVADRLGLSVRAVPTEMLAAKRMQLLINRKLKESK